MQVFFDHRRRALVLKDDAAVAADKLADAEQKAVLAAHEYANPKANGLTYGRLLRRTLKDAHVLTACRKQVADILAKRNPREWPRLIREIEKRNPQFFKTDDN